MNWLYNLELVKGWKHRHNIIDSKYNTSSLVTLFSAHPSSSSIFFRLLMLRGFIIMSDPFYITRGHFKHCWYKNIYSCSFKEKSHTSGTKSFQRKLTHLGFYVKGHKSHLQPYCCLFSFKVKCHSCLII